MSSFDEMRRASLALAKEISEAMGVQLPLILNVIQYAKRLCHPSHPGVIDEVVFISQMGNRFDITSVQHIRLMFSVISVKDTKYVRMEDFVRLICLFFSKKLDMQIDFVFSVYDFLRDYSICAREMAALLKTSIVTTSNDDDEEEQLKELIRIVVKTLDLDGDGLISLEEFRKKVHENILYIQLLGQVIPHKAKIESFMRLLSMKTQLETREYFAGERSQCLSDPMPPDTSEMHYPITLDLP